MGKAESVYMPKPKAKEDNANTNKPDASDDASNIPAPQSAAEALAIRDMLQKAQQDVPPSMNPGEGHHESKGGIPDNINDALNNAIDDVYANKAVQQDIKAKQRVIVGGDG